MNNAIVKKIVQYAEKKAHTTKQCRYQRSYQQTVKDLIFGKFGEYVAAEKYGIKNIDLEVYNNVYYSDGGVDLKLKTGETVSVKTINSTHTYFMLNADYDEIHEVDYFIVVKLPRQYGRDSYNFDSLYRQAKVSRLIPAKEFFDNAEYHAKGPTSLGFTIQCNNLVYDLKRVLFSKLV